MSKLINHLPKYLRKSKIFNEIFNSEEIELDLLLKYLKEVELQLTVDTATWGLAIYEKELKLPLNPNVPINERRAIIKAKMRGTGKVEAIMIQNIVEAFTNKKARIGFNGKINIIFEDQEHIDISNKNMLYAIEEIKPCHLDYDFKKKINTQLELITKFIINEIEYPMCGEYYCGTYPFDATDGMVADRTIIEIDTEYNKDIHEYPETSERNITDSE